MQPQKYLLRDILGIRPISQNTISRPQHLRLTLPDNFIKGIGQSA